MMNFIPYLVALVLGVGGGFAAWTYSPYHAERVPDEIVEVMEAQDEGVTVAAGRFAVQIPTGVGKSMAVMMVDATVATENALVTIPHLRAAVADVLHATLEMPIVTTAPDIAAAVEQHASAVAQSRAPWVYALDVRLVGEHAPKEPEPPSQPELGHNDQEQDLGEPPSSE